MQISGGREASRGRLGEAAHESRRARLDARTDCHVVYNVDVQLEMQHERRTALRISVKGPKQPTSTATVDTPAAMGAPRAQCPVFGLEKCTPDDVAKKHCAIAMYVRFRATYLRRSDSSSLRSDRSSTVAVSVPDNATGSGCSAGPSITVERYSLPLRSPAKNCPAAPCCPLPTGVNALVRA